MKLGDKNAYPIKADEHYIEFGLTFRERLIIALAGNPNMITRGEVRINPDQITLEYQLTDSAKLIIDQADVIISELEKENK